LNLCFCKYNRVAFFWLNAIFQADTSFNINKTIALAYLKVMNEKSAFTAVQKGLKRMD